MSVRQIELDDTNWMRCPVCSSSQIEGGSVSIEHTTAWQSLDCIECGAEWTEVYEAAHREIDEEPSEPAVAGGKEGTMCENKKIDWANIDEELERPGTYLGIKEDEDGNPYMYIRYGQTGHSSAKDLPWWFELTPEERRVPLTKDFVRNTMFYALNTQSDASVTLPCPPYEYQYDEDENELHIAAGPYTKSGSKEEWQAFIDQAQAEVDKMPNEIDVSSLSIEVTVQSQANSQWTIRVDASEFLFANDKYDNMDDVWVGTKAELSAAIEKGVKGLEKDDLSPTFDSPDWQEFGERWADIDDINYDLSDIPEDGDGA